MFSEDLDPQYLGDGVQVEKYFNAKSYDGHININVFSRFGKSSRCEWDRTGFQGVFTVAEE